MTQTYSQPKAEIHRYLLTSTLVLYIIAMAQSNEQSDVL